MSLNDILKAKSTEEQEDLKRRGFVEQSKGGKWKFQILIAEILNKFEEEEDTQEFKDSLIEILENKKEDVEIYIAMTEDPDSVDYVMTEYENIIDEFQVLDEYPELDGVDYVLNMLYDFANDNNIWIESMDY